VGIDRIQVVAAAAAIADREGLAQLTLAQVAAKLGVKLPSLYNHVDGLAGLHRELALLGARQLDQALARAAVGKAGDEAVFAVAHAYRAFVLNRPGLYAATVPAPDADDEEHRALARAVVETVAAALGPFHLGEEGTIHAVRGLRALVHGFATIEQAGGFGLPVSLDASFDRLLRAYLAGLRSMEQRADTVHR
jgi:AcrR family transcriptional regulator